jgi:hypothetical protein
MTTETLHSPEVRRGAYARVKPNYGPLTLETRSHVDTLTAAHYLLRRPQTLRDWACRSGTGPIKPQRINTRLAWPVGEIKALMGVPA